jgi:nucleoside-diphosphate-sugar epimerase
MFAEALRAGARPVVYGDGRQTRDFTFVANAVHANLLAAASPARLAGEVANVACGTRYSLLELLDAMGSALGRRAEPEFRPARAGDVQDSEADIRHAEELLGYRVIVPFVEGLRLTLA